VVAITAMPISAVPTSPPCAGPPASMGTMFSRTTIASSISTPMASDSRGVMKLAKPHSHTAMKAAITEVGRRRDVGATS
jgi:hypothetical protein